jgi:hypothetical protein
MFESVEFDTVDEYGDVVRQRPPASASVRQRHYYCNECDAMHLDAYNGDKSRNCLLHELCQKPKKTTSKNGKKTRAHNVGSQRNSGFVMTGACFNRS